MRRWTLGSVAVGVGLTGCLVAQAEFLAHALAAGMHHDTAAIRGSLVGLVVATSFRAALAFGADVTAAAASGLAKAQLRAEAIGRLLAARPASLDLHPTGELTVALGHGLDALDAYIGRYLPRLVLAVLAPVVLLAWIARLDLVSAGILAVTLVLLPIFMILVGQVTQQRVALRWAALARLSAHFLDAVEGLPTLRAFGRSAVQRGQIAEGTDRLRRTTLATLRVAFLSSLVLETLAAVGTALVAVPLGLRLVDGRMALTTALTILFLTPEVYLPLRRASAEFHASTEGTAAADAILTLLDDEAAPPADQPMLDDGSVLVGARPGPPPAPAPGGVNPLTLDDVSVAYGSGRAPALIGVTLSVAPGEHVAVVGPSGAGKSTLASVAAGLLAPTTGRVLVGGLAVDGATLVAWRARVAWVPQRPTIFSGSLADNLRLGAPKAPAAELWAALTSAGLADLVSGLPDGLETLLTELGTTLSAGERQRLGLARALVRADADLVVLDEPTAHLDLETEAEVVAGLRIALAGRAALIITHRRQPLELADRVVSLRAGRLSPTTAAVLPVAAA